MREETYGRRRRPKNYRANEHDQVMIRIIVSLSLSSLGFGEMNSFKRYGLIRLMIRRMIMLSISRLTVTAMNDSLVSFELSLPCFMNNGHDTAGSSR